MTPNCIDVSSWQSNIDWKRVKAAGIEAVIIRAGFGTTKDNQFENHYASAKAAGLHIGAYWYSYAYSNSEAEQEAKACLAILKGKDFDMPVYYDMEEDGQISLGSTAMTAIACRFLDTVQAAGYRVGMYSSPSWFSDFIDYDLMRSRYSIWLAHWASSHSRACDIWQYSENGRVDGVNGNVDVNIIENRNVISGAAAKPPDGVTAAQAMDAAYSLVGKDEKPGECDVMAWYGGFDTDINAVACCCAGMMYLFFKVLNAGKLIPGGKVADCGSLALNFYNAGQLHRPSEIRPGDLVIFSWSHDRTSVSPLDSLGYMCFEHVELCLDVHDDTIRSVGANNGGTECDDFQIKTRRRSDIAACCRPKYADSGEASTGTYDDTTIGNDTVKAVQQWVNDNYNTGIDVDGIYGSQTRRALTKALQTELNNGGASLEVDGVCGQLTKAAVRNVKKGDTGALVSALQGFLICNGYQTGGHDGVFGSMTEAAVLTYQAANGLVVDGIAGKETFGNMANG